MSALASIMGPEIATNLAETWLGLEYVPLLQSTNWYNKLRPTVSPFSSQTFTTSNLKIQDIELIENEEL